MRISTSQIFDAGSSNMLKSQSSLYKLQNQLSTGRRVLTPQDDPVAAAQALVVTQTAAVNQQYIESQGQAKNQLALVDTQLTSLTNALNNIRDKVVQAGNTMLSPSDRESIAAELEARLGEMMGIANMEDGTGDYLFSGYKGKVKPFAVSGEEAIEPALVSPVKYYGDEGERSLQVSASRLMGISVQGNELFQNIRNGNGTFVTSTNDVLATDAAATLGFDPTITPRPKNQGTALIDKGSVSDQGKWATSGNPGKFMIRFSVADVAGVSTTTYQVYDNTSSTAPVAITPAKTYSAGQLIALAAENPPATAAADYGASVVVSGAPKDGDSFTIEPSTSQSMFQTVQNLLGILRTPIGSSTYTTTQYTNDLAGELVNIDQSLANVSRIQSGIGTKEQEIESLGTTASDLAIQYKSTLSDLQDVDYAATISSFMQQQMNLQAAQSSFAKISGLSLFNYL